MKNLFPLDNTAEACYLRHHEIMMMNHRQLHRETLSATQSGKTNGSIPFADTGSKRWMLSRCIGNNG